MSSSVPAHETEQPLIPLARQLNLRETILEQLRTAIITGHLPEGELVSAPMLGNSLGVSATPVREAMMDLSHEGLVEAIKNRGFRVTRMSEKELDDLAQVRLFVEPPAMHLVAGKLPDSAIDTLTRFADSCLHAAERADLEEYLHNDREFHAFALSFTNNPQLVALATSLRTKTRLYGIGLLARKGRLADSARDHHRLIELLASGDGDGAESLMCRHITHARSIWATEAALSANDEEPPHTP